MAKYIDIKLRSKYDDTGAKKAKENIKGLAGMFDKLSEAIGGTNSYLGKAISNFIKGGIWEMAAYAVGFLGKKIIEWWTASERAEKEAMKASLENVKKVNEERLAALEKYREAYEKLRSTQDEITNHELKLKKDEIDATKELTKATLELEKANARRRGDKAGMAAIDEKMKAADYQAALASAEEEHIAAQKRANISDINKANIQKEINKVLEERKEVRNEMRDALQDVHLHNYDDDDSEAKKIANERYDELAKNEKALTKRLKGLWANREKEDRTKERAIKDQEKISAQIEALRIREQARVANDEATRQEELTRQKEADQKAVAEAERKAIAEAAKERERLDKEAHQKRMDMLKAEIAASEKLANPLKAVASAAQSEFDRAFAMYRDPEKAAAAIGEEKAYSADLDRLHRDATRYGGKWRIDELSRLMAAGDSQGVTDTLASWRKNSKFTPQVEAMVRASAAERTKTTAEDELRKIEHNTANLAAKVEELLTMKG